MVQPKSGFAPQGLHNCMSEPVHSRPDHVGASQTMPKINRSRGEKIGPYFFIGHINQPHPLMFFFLCIYNKDYAANVLPS